MSLDMEKLREDWDEAWNNKWVRHLIPEPGARRFEIELNGVGDNPIFFPENGTQVSGANFQHTDGVWGWFWAGMGRI